MNRLLSTTAIFISGLILLAACEKQNKPESIPVKPMLERSAEYYTSLKAYKQSDHQLYFGWFGGTGGAGDPRVAGVLDHIPDSVDIVSLWGGVPPVGSHNASLLKKMQEQKGTRFVKVFFPNYFDGFNFPHDESGVRMFADTLIRMVNESGLDGIDIDYESHVLSIFSNDRYMTLLMSELGKSLGPQSGTNKLLIVDSFVEHLPPDIIPFMSYYVVQAYSPQGGSVHGLPSRFDQAFGMPYEKCIATENYESVWQSGGLLLDYARWNPQGGRKGGVGSYHTEYEYANSPDYKFTREAIQIMNPAGK